ncbi:TSC22 domain family protein 1-like [Ptychodera flava]|uniref:TSC22 domain family protein 1-like n=1 Tax=Ptychodera flava TaxID=63121 RepID=UPI003969DED3
MAESGLQEEANMADNKSVFVDIGDETTAQYLANTVASHKKKSCFQITSVKVSENTNNDDNESIDDLDESHAEDVSSDMLDLSKNTEDTLDENHAIIQQEIITHDDNVNQNSHGNGHCNGPSRFRVVKVETIEPIKRGRWTCTDYLDPPAEKEQINVPPDRTIEKEPTGSGNSSAASSVHYVPGQDSNAENPLNVVHEQQPQSAQTQTQPQQNQAPTQSQQPPTAQQAPQQQSQNAVNNFENATSAAAPQNNGQDSIQSSTTQSQPPSNPIDYGTHSMVEHIRDSLSVDMSSGAPSTDGQSEGEDSASGASVGAIDNKIEQAMDLVKSHLMYAVREEVEVLKEQIKELLERNSQLEKENNTLRQQQVAASSGSAAVQAQQASQPVQPQPNQAQIQSPNQSNPSEATAPQAVLTQPQTQS